MDISLLNLYAALRYRNSYHHQTALGKALSWLGLAILAGAILAMVKMPEEKAKKYKYAVRVTAVALFGLIIFAFSYIYDALSSF
jgi:hypothetical protein